jgi:hypothetical protein
VSHPLSDQEVILDDQYADWRLRHDTNSPRQAPLYPSTIGTAAEIVDWEALYAAIGGERLRLASPDVTHPSQLAPPLRQPLVILAVTPVCAS